MAKIFIAIPEYKPWKEFEESMSLFLPEVNKQHDMEVYRTRGKSLVDAQNLIANKFLASDKDYLLFLEEDHWGHTIEMLNALVESDTFICAIQYYSRHPGRISCLLRYTGLKDYKHRYKEIPEAKGFEQCNLVPFGMTLIKRQLFDKIDEPYFRVNDYYECDAEKDKPINSRATDQDFSNRVQAVGIIPIGCFNFNLTHRGIHRGNFMDYRKQDILDSFLDAEQRVINVGVKRIMAKRAENKVA